MYKLNLLKLLNPFPGFLFVNEINYYTDPAWLSLTNERKFVDEQQQINER